MKDIDFDELDRAVSSVLGQDKPVQAKTTSDKVVDSNTPKKTDNVQASETDTTVSTNAITINPRPKTTGIRPSGPSLATARRGKFMDFTHQSVQTQSAKPASEQAPKRDMVTLEPSKALIASSEKAKQEPSEEPVESAETTSIVEHTAEPTATLDESNALIGAEPAPATADLLESPPVSDQERSPEKEDQIEQKEVTEEFDRDELKPEKPSKIEDDLKELSIEDVPVANSSLSSSVPQESPFLADTKVEKRPLGGSAEEVGKEDDLAGYGIGTYEKKDAQSTPVVPGPRELEDDIVRVEAAQNEQDQTETGSPLTANVAASAEPTNDGRVDGHPLFDTSTYHEPISAVHKDGMPGWAKWLIGLMLCLALGAGVGYFLFTAGL